MFKPNRNLVTRFADGRVVNVARMRGHLFVCHENCCCGRVEDGFAPVPVDLYQDEWERRRLRNVVHLTVGGCLGPELRSHQPIERPKNVGVFGSEDRLHGHRSPCSL